MPVIWTDVVFSTLIIQTKSGVICLTEAWEGDYPAKSLDILLGSAHRDAIQSAWKRGGPLPVCRSFAVAQDDSNRTKTAQESFLSCISCVPLSNCRTVFRAMQEVYEFSLWLEVYD